MADHKLSKTSTQETSIPDVSEVVSTTTKIPRKKKNETPEERKVRKEAERSLRHPSELREEKLREKKTSKKDSTLSSIPASTPTSTSASTLQQSTTSTTLPVSEKSLKTSTKTLEKKRTKKVEKVVEPEVELVQEVEPLTFGLDITSSRRRALERDELETYFDQYIKAVESELEQSRENKNRKVNVRTWRLLLNEIRRLKSVSLRVMKKPKKRSENAQSGFMKPVHISQEMADFAGWNLSELKSRVDVTKYICNYIKEHNLQNPQDRRQILADDKLSKLLKHSSSDTPLTYYLLQKKIQPHFIHSQ